MSHKRPAIYASTCCTLALISVNKLLRLWLDESDDSSGIMQTLFWVPSLFTWDIVVYIGLAFVVLELLPVEPSSDAVFMSDGQEENSELPVNCLLSLNTLSCSLALVDTCLLLETGTFKRTKIYLILGSSMEYNEAWHFISSPGMWSIAIPQLAACLILQLLILMVQVRMYRYLRTVFFKEVNVYAHGKRLRLSSNGIQWKPIVKHWIYYQVLVMMFRPTAPWSIISQPSILNAVSQCLTTSPPLPTNNDPSTVTEITPDPTKQPQNFDLPRTVDISSKDFKHIVVVVLESARRDIFSGNPTKDIAKHLTDPEVVSTSQAFTFHDSNSPNVDTVLSPESGAVKTQRLNPTPFFQSLVEGGISAPFATSTSSYTIKSILSMMCGVYPLAVNYNLESIFATEHQCLPTLLRNITQSSGSASKSIELLQEKLYSLYQYGKRIAVDVDKMDRIVKDAIDSLGSDFFSAFIQPSDLQFDRQSKTMKKMGFDLIFGRDELKDFFSDHVEEANYFGYSDHEMLPAALRVVDHIKSRPDKRLFMTLLTSVNHHPWRIPASLESRYPTKTYSTVDPTLNGYLNTVSYTDSFIEDFMRQMDKRDMTKDTFFVIVGDHGVSMGEHNKYGVVGNVYEPAFKIPLLIYPGWKNMPMSLSGNWTNIDIMPTIMDIFGRSSELSNYDGQSMLRQYRSRMQVSLTSTGGGPIIVRQGDFKAVFPIKNMMKQGLADQIQESLNQNIDGELLFDLEEDPDERFSLVSEWRRLKLKSLALNPVFEWFDESRTFAHEWIRRNHVKYKYVKYEN